MKNEQKQEQKSESITIKPANLVILPLTIEGDAPYVQHKFSQKALRQIEETQKAGSTATSKRKREPKDFEENWRQAMHIGTDGRHGIPASAFRNASISACRVAGFVMTKAKLSIFIVADVFDKDDGTPLVHISPKPRAFKDTVSLPVRNDNGSVDLRMRPMWDPGWRANLRVRFDADVFTPTDVANLINRVGQQVGIGEGRPDSKESAGVGWGTFTIVG